MNKQKDNFFLLPNSIFDEGLTPMEFTVYGFLTSRGDAKGQKDRVIILCRTLRKPAVCVRTPAARRSAVFLKKD